MQKNQCNTREEQEKSNSETNDEANVTDNDRVVVTESLFDLQARESILHAKLLY